MVRAVAEHHRPGLLITPDMTTARQLEAELHFFAPRHLEIFLLPDWETLPYDLFSPSEEITARRIETLRRLPELECGICIVAADTLLQYVVPAAFVRNATFSLKSGDTLDLTAFRRQLSDNCYVASPQVVNPGEFAVRGSVIDFYPPPHPTNRQLPVRVDLLIDRIESLRLFDPDQQTSVRRVDSVVVQPAREFSLDEQSVMRFRQRFRAAIEHTDTRLYHDISNGIVPGGIEYYLPLFFDNMATLFDYLPDNAIVFSPYGMDEQIEAYWQLIWQRYKQAQLDQDRPLLPPEQLFLDKKDLSQAARRFDRVETQSFEDAAAKAKDGGTRLLPTVFVQSHSTRPLANLKRFIDNFGGRVLIAAHSPGYLEQITDLLHRADLSVHNVDDWHAFCEHTAPLCVCIGDVHNGVVFERMRLAVISDAQILGRKGGSEQRSRRRTPPADAIIHSLTDLTDGCPVVHEEHGVGRYRGLERLDVGGCPFEFLVMEYADGDKLYVPISSLHLLTRYTGGNSDTAPLHKLGEARWQRSKRKAAQKAFDVAAELLDTQARREVAPGTAFRVDEDEYRQFTEKFPYQETPDQQRAMQEILNDMERPRPMDRIVCGDVGFGKTELAMRATFNAVHNNHQVVVADSHHTAHLATL